MFILKGRKSFTVAANVNDHETGSNIHLSIPDISHLEDKYWLKLGYYAIKSEKKSANDIKNLIHNKITFFQFSCKSFFKVVRIFEGRSHFSVQLFTRGIIKLTLLSSQFFILGAHR